MSRYLVTPHSFITSSICYLTSCFCCRIYNFVSEGYLYDKASRAVAQVSKVSSTVCFCRRDDVVAMQFTHLPITNIAGKGKVSWRNRAKFMRMILHFILFKGVMYGLHYHSGTIYHRLNITARMCDVSTFRLRFYNKEPLFQQTTR